MRIKSAPSSCSLNTAREASLILLGPRLLVWYTVITALFRCPSSSTGLTPESPRICKPYLDARRFVAPHVQPYYDIYVLPYVESARPYTETLNHHIYEPSLNFGSQCYKKYGAPRVDRAREYGYDRWARKLKPQIDAAQASARNQYHATIAPQINKVSAAITPYYKVGQMNAVTVYNTRILPLYTTARPHILKTYEYLDKVAVESGLPYAQAAWGSTVALVERTLWPHLRILYGENVEPQLFKIRERLGRYRDGRKLKAVVEDADR